MPAVDLLQTGTTQARAEEERRVLGQRGGRVLGELSPHLARERERAAVHVLAEQSTVERIADRPESPGLELEEGDGSEARDVGPSRDQRAELRRQPAWRVPVVVVPLHEEVTLGLCAGQIALRTDALAPRAADVPDPRVIGHQLRQAVLAVVDDDQLPRLGNPAFERAGSPEARNPPGSALASGS